MWDFPERQAIPKSAVPLGTMVTMAATGSEMNDKSVITHDITHEKLAWGSPLAFMDFWLASAAEIANKYHKAA